MRLGTTWSVPEDAALAAADLIEMRAAGFSMVRVGQIASTDLLTLADTIGIDVYQDLPLRGVPSDVLADTMSAVRAILTDLVFLTHRHRSLKGIGLADMLDSSDPVACEYVVELSDVVRESAAPGTVSYYTTRFVNDDQCSPTADMVLLDLRDTDTSVVRRHTKALASMGARVGVGAVGTWTDLDLEASGLNHSRSPESQARYLERVLSSVQAASTRGGFSIVFVHRWRDPAGTDDVFADMVQRRYGLHNSSGGRRPVFGVASGFATGRQTVFAFPAGSRRPSGWTWMTLLGWALSSALAIAFATSPRMRHMVPRYFLAHAFYRDAVSSGRELLVSETLAFLAAVAGGVGMLLAILVNELSFRPVFAVGRIWLSPELRDFVGALIDQPWTLTIIIASAYALLVVIWISILSFVTRSRHTLLPAQVMMLVVWPQWPLVAFVLVSPAIVSVDDGTRLTLAAIAACAGIGLMMLAAVRTMTDYWRCSGVSPGLVVVAVLVHPVMIWLLAAIVIASRHPGETQYIWHLLTRM
jgi:hypothetical protein